MKIVLPKELTSTKTDLINVIEFNTFDIDELLPTLYYRILAEGRERGKAPNDSSQIREYVTKLAEHPNIKGFNGRSELRTLERLTRSALVVMKRQGEGHKAEQIVTVQPYTILAHKSGFPNENRRLRSVDSFLFWALAEHLGGPSAPRSLLIQLLGKGLKLDSVGGKQGGSYDGITTLDTLTRLSLHFLDGLQYGDPPRRELQSRGVGPAPDLVHQVAEGLLCYLQDYAPLMPGMAFAEHFKGLINLELFIYSLRLVHAMNALASNPHQLPAAFGGAGSIEPLIYLDFVGSADGLNRLMAKRLVQRDYEALQRFSSASVTVILLQRYLNRAQNNPRYKAQLDSALPAERYGARYLQALLTLGDREPFATLIDAAAAQDEAAIQAASEEATTAESSSWAELTEPITAGSQTQLERVVRLITSVQAKVTRKYSDWFSGTGGLTKPHGILSGTKGHRSTWRYEPGNDLLAILVQLAAGHARQRGELHDGRLPLRDFLRFIEQRFGLIVDRPPPEFVGAEYQQAARENLRALQSRLRQMGIFSDLSDDFTVQHLLPPYLTQD
jgi:hypothetical protein